MKNIKSNTLVRVIHGERFTPFALCTKLNAKALLESASFEQGRGRYSILLVREAFSISHNKNGIYLSVDGYERKIDENRKYDPALTGANRSIKTRDILDYALDFANEHTGEKFAFPFPAGGIGYLTYDYAFRFDEIRVAERPDSLGIPDAYFLFGHVFLVFDHYTDTISIIGVNYREHQINLEKAIRDTEERINDLDFNYLLKPGKNYSSSVLLREEDREEFLNGVSKVRREIIKGNLLQGVLSRRLYVRSEIPALEAYRRLRSLNPSPYMFYLDTGSFQLFGASPEIHIKVEHDRARIRPLAGTRRRGKTREEDLLLEHELKSDSKEKAEHLMLVDLARNDLGKVCRAGSVEVTTSMEVERYSAVMHLVSQVEGTLESEKTGIDAIRATFPAGTVTGAPKIRAMEVLSHLERERRSFYAGLVGYIEPEGSLDTCITIRSALKNDDIIVLQAGAGIVYDSVPEREYDETEAKLSALLRALFVEV
ncbi:MAG: chorismate-binding protein [Spirochaetota bacterium]